MSNLLQDLLAEKPWLMADGATGTNLFAAGLETGEAPELWNEQQPDKIVAFHASMVDSGADIVLTNSFGGSRCRLKWHHAQDRVGSVNATAARLVREAAAGGGRPIVVAGSIGPTGEIMEPLGALSYSDAVAAFAEQAAALAEGGADVLWIETMSSLDEVRAAAAKALEPKIVQIGGISPEEREAQPGSVSATVSRTITLTLQNPHGLHARPAARPVQTAASFQAEIWVSDVTNGKGPAPARSQNALAILGATKGHQLAITASVPQAESALAAWSQLVHGNFGEATFAEEPLLASSAEPGVRPPAAGAPLQGIAISEGIALGPLHLYQPSPPAIPQYQAEDPRLEWERLQLALQQAKVVIQARRQKISERLGEGQAAIFDAHLLILQDAELLGRVQERIFVEGQNAAQAWQGGIEDGGGKLCRAG